MSRPSEPVETTWISSMASPSPRRMIDPLPNCFSIWASAACRAFAFSLLSAEAPLLYASMRVSDEVSGDYRKSWMFGQYRQRREVDALLQFLKEHGARGGTPVAAGPPEGVPGA